MRNTTEIEIIPPESIDGYKLNRLIQASPPLDTNSVYCNLLQCTHFPDTSICAKSGSELVGFISGYFVPARPDTLFVWQVVVAESARGQGLASRMLMTLLDQPACKEVCLLETTITASNGPSRALFRKLADTLHAAAEISEGFDREKHFNSRHESEQLWRIGPIPKTQARVLI